MRVLIVDDTKVNRVMLRRTLQNYGISEDDIFESEDGHIAVKMVQESEWNFDIIFMDHQMPMMQGDEATRLIREVEAKQPCSESFIITCSGSYEGTFPGANDSLPKPLNSAKLKALLARIEKERKELHPQNTLTLASPSAPIASSAQNQSAFYQPMAKEPALASEDNAYRL